jgi:hypothetical protein
MDRRPGVRRGDGARKRGRLGGTGILPVIRQKRQAGCLSHQSRRKHRIAFVL